MLHILYGCCVTGVIFSRDKAHNVTLNNETPTVIIRDTNNSKDCGILKCRPTVIQKYAGIKVQTNLLKHRQMGTSEKLSEFQFDFFFQK